MRRDFSEKEQKDTVSFVSCVLNSFSNTFFDYGYIKANAANSGSYTYIVINGEAVIVDVDDAISGDIVIPDRFGIFKVTKIGENAFDGCMNVKKSLLADL